MKRRNDGLATPAHLTPAHRLKVAKLGERKPYKTDWSILLV